VALSNSILDREYAKFKECNNETAVRVNVCQGEGESLSVEFNEAGVKFRVFNAIPSVASGSTIVMIAYTVPVGKKVKLDSIQVSGTNIAKYRVKINGSPFAIRRTNFGTELNTEFVMYSYEVAASGIVEVEVTNNRPYSGDYEVTLIGKLLDV